MNAIGKSGAHSMQNSSHREGIKNKMQGERFLAENGKKSGIKSLPNGLQYKVLEKGDGKKPKSTDEVVVHYKGTTIDGKEFDSSMKRGKPSTFKLNQVIPGWREGLRMMKEGAKWQLFVPPDLGYGAKGSGRNVGPNQTLIFDVELLEVK